MSVNINVEDMPQSAQTAYARKNKLRGITMKICWALTPVLFVIFCIMSLVNKTFSEDIEFDLEVALTLGCGLQGLMHIGFFYKRAIRAEPGTRWSTPCAGGWRSWTCPLCWSPPDRPGRLDAETSGASVFSCNMGRSRCAGSPVVVCWRGRQSEIAELPCLVAGMQPGGLIS